MDSIKYSIQIVITSIVYYGIYKLLGADILFITIAATLVVMVSSIIDKLNNK